MHCVFDVIGVQILHFRLRDLPDLFACQRSHLGFVRLSGSLVNFQRLPDKFRCGRRLCYKCKRTVSIYGNDDRNNVSLPVLRLLIELFAEFHDVHAMLTQCRADGR